MSLTGTQTTNRTASAYQGSREGGVGRSCAMWHANPLCKSCATAGERGAGCGSQTSIRLRVVETRVARTYLRYSVGRKLRIDSSLPNVTQSTKTMMSRPEFRIVQHHEPPNAVTPAYNNDARTTRKSVAADSPGDVNRPVLQVPMTRGLARSPTPLTGLSPDSHFSPSLYPPCAPQLPPLLLPTRSLRRKASSS